MGADPRTELADFAPPLATAVASTLREHGVAAEVEGQDSTRVLVPASQRDEAVAIMAARMEEIRGRTQRSGTGGEAVDEEPPARTRAPSSQPARDPEPRAVDDEPATRPLLTERLRRLWPLALLLVPAVALLGQARVPLDLVPVVLIGGMALVLMLRQRRRR